MSHFYSAATTEMYIFILKYSIIFLLQNSLNLNQFYRQNRYISSAMKA